MPTEDEYSVLVDQLSERLSDDGSEARIREIARTEADKRILPLLFLGALLWASKSYGSVGVITVLGVGLVLLVWHFKSEPMHEQHLAVSKAEDLVRLQSLLKRSRRVTRYGK